MTTNHYCPLFTDPSPSRIAADRIVTAGSARPGALRDSLRCYADQLVEAGAFADLTADDARTVATTIAWDVCHGDESTALRQRATTMTDGWDHPIGVARAFTIAAHVLDAL
ncbi:hypothetical protein A5633_17060 [Mycolicibacterium elephantis]|uniref:hypothetical protein n=1 Tax=Mycolicibacterium elephantis TaxID=81858 RepID=UPI0007EAA34D|nr:hypothetical protein [Mycolicibacterium elephantis]OBA79329.1 hypothetical protein A5633_17060 [Mycolicibacterium elephantis]